MDNEALKALLEASDVREILLEKKKKKRDAGHIFHG
jgi:hypothetical protein